jgi:hypothetical protein
LEELINKFIKATTVFDVEAALSLFSTKAVIDDVSVGKKFKGVSGVRKYLEEYFMGYHTVTKLDSLEVLDAHHAKAHVDFTGDFGHEKGVLDMTTDADGLIVAIKAWLL